MFDPTENLRRELTAELNAKQDESDALVLRYGKDNVWNTRELSAQFEVQSFLAPFCMVKRRSDGQRGTVMFQHSPRFYFDFQPT